MACASSQTLRGFGETDVHPQCRGSYECRPAFERPAAVWHGSSLQAVRREESKVKGAAHTVLANVYCSVQTVFVAARALQGGVVILL